jgi:hypothetical protein
MNRKKLHRSTRWRSFQLDQRLLTVDVAGDAADSLEAWACRWTTQESSRRSEEGTEGARKQPPTQGSDGHRKQALSAAR